MLLSSLPLISPSVQTERRGRSRLEEAEECVKAETEAEDNERLRDCSEVEI